LVNDFEERLGTEVRQQVGERKAERKKYRRMELPGKYTAKLLYGWDDKKFEEEYLEKLEWNWKRWKEDREINENEYLKRIEEREKEEKRLENRTFLQRRNLERRVMSRSQKVDFVSFYFLAHFYFIFDLFLFLLFLELWG